MNKPIKIPSLPFASSISGGEQHIGVQPVNKAYFDLKYLAGLYQIHESDIPQLLTRELAKAFYGYVNMLNKDLSLIMFERLVTLEAKGIICTPSEHDGKSIITLAYHFNASADTLHVTVSLMNIKGNASEDCPYLAFTAEVIEEENIIGFSIPIEVSVPHIFRHDTRLDDLLERACYWVNYICAFEAMFAYHCLRFKSFSYDAMLEKDGVYLKPNFVQVNLLTFEDEEKPSI